MKITRRTLLISGGVLGGGFLLGVAGIGGYVGSYDQRAIQQGARGRIIATWIELSSSGQVTILSPHTEMGQGVMTGLRQIVLEELDADPEQTTIEMAPATPEFANSDNIAGFILGGEGETSWTRTFVEKGLGRAAHLVGFQATGGSGSIRFTGWRGMRTAAATAREMLLSAAATRLKVPASELTTDMGQIVHAGSGRKVSYGEVAEAASKLDVPTTPKFKDPSEWKYVGKRSPRVDIPDKVFARTVYGIDVEVPEMRYAAVAPPPIAGANVVGVDNEAELLKRRGVEAVVVMKDAVAVVADNPWRAEQAARAARVLYQEPDGGLLDSGALLEHRRQTIAAGGLDTVYSVGDAATALTAKGVIEAEYVAPFLAHSPMEPLNATIWSEGGKTHVASGVQAPLGARVFVAGALDVDLEEVVFHPHTMGGAFGRRGGMDEVNNNWLRQAADIHKAVGGAVKMTWSREADTQLSTYRPADMARLRARLGADGKPVAWFSQTYAKVNNPHETTPMYDIPHVTIESANQPPALPFAYWRSVDASTHSFFIESFIDELAVRAGKDPVAYRLSLLSSKARHRRVLKHVAEMAQWGKPGPAGTARGVAIFESFGSIVAEVAEVSREGDQPRVHRVWCAVDCGVAINPDGVESQMQGGIIYGLSAALYGAITVKEGRIIQSNFHNYKPVRFSDGPAIEVAILSSPDAPVGGAGEPGTPPIAPAVANALAALDRRQRALPLVPQV